GPLLATGNGLAPDNCPVQRVSVDAQCSIHAGQHGHGSNLGDLDLVSLGKCWPDYSLRRLRNCPCTDDLAALLFRVDQTLASELAKRFVSCTWRAGPAFCHLGHGRHPLAVT